MTVAADGELPARFDVLARQRQRWSIGTAQSFRTLPWALLKKPGLPQAIVFCLLSLFYASCSAVLMAAVAIVAVS